MSKALQDMAALLAEFALKVAQVLTRPFFDPGRRATGRCVMIGDLKDYVLVVHLCATITNLLAR